MDKSLIALQNKIINDPFWSWKLDEKIAQRREEAYREVDAENIDKSTADIIDMLFMPLSKLVKEEK